MTLGLFQIDSWSQKWQSATDTSAIERDWRIQAWKHLTVIPAQGKWEGNGMFKANLRFITMPCLWKGSGINFKYTWDLQAAPPPSMVTGGHLLCEYFTVSTFLARISFIASVSIIITVILSEQRRSWKHQQAFILNWEKKNWVRRFASNKPRLRWMKMVRLHWAYSLSKALFFLRNYLKVWMWLNHHILHSPISVLTNCTHLPDSLSQNATLITFSPARWSS